MSNEDDAAAESAANDTPDTDLPAEGEGEAMGDQPEPEGQDATLTADLLAELEAARAAGEEEHAGLLETVREPDSVAAMEKRDRELESEFKRHATRLETLYGEQWEERGLCPACEGEGYLTPWPPGAMMEEQWAAVEALCGQTGGESFKVASYIRRCEECEGRGMVATLAQPPAQTSLPCKRCGGAGFFDNELHPLPITAPTAPTAPLAAAPAPGGVVPGSDTWGRPPGHVHWGIPPALVAA